MESTFTKHYQFYVNVRFQVSVYEGSFFDGHIPTKKILLMIYYHTLRVATPIVNVVQIVEVSKQTAVDWATNMRDVYGQTGLSKVLIINSCVNLD